MNSLPTPPPQKATSNIDRKNVIVGAILLLIIGTVTFLIAVMALIEKNETTGSLTPLDPFFFFLLPLLIIGYALKLFKKKKDL